MPLLSSARDVAAEMTWSWCYVDIESKLMTALPSHVGDGAAESYDEDAESCCRWCCWCNWAAT
jgi:hypothetical protein